MGGGLTGQADAIRHGLARTIAKMETPLQKLMRKEGFLTRDSRIVERKKPGRPKARKRFQFSKR
jgi:small subunit ribosomal protein S9